LCCQKAEQAMSDLPPEQLPELTAQGWSTGIIYSRVLRFWGIAESALVEKVAPLLALTNPTVVPYADQGEARLRISARAESEPAAQDLIRPVEFQICQLTGLDCYGSDDDTLASVVGQQLQRLGQTLAVAESCTGGGLGQALTSIPGSSNYFPGGVIAYDNRVKVSLLGVDPEALITQGAVSAIVAEQMALGVGAQLQTDWGLSITGIAGPGGGSDTKPVGLVYIGLASNQEVESFAHQFGDFRSREWIRMVSASTALDHLRRKLLAA
jgi:nicotinamide-nucleotide amidase